MSVSLKRTIHIGWQARRPDRRGRGSTAAEAPGPRRRKAPAARIGNLVRARPDHWKYGLRPGLPSAAIDGRANRSRAATPIQVLASTASKRRANILIRPCRLSETHSNASGELWGEVWVLLHVHRDGPPAVDSAPSAQAQPARPAAGGVPAPKLISRPPRL